MIYINLMLCTWKLVDTLNDSITDLGVSPVKVTRVNDKNRLPYGKRKVHQLQSAAATKVAQVFDVDEDDLSKQGVSQSTTCTNY